MNPVDSTQQNASIDGWAITQGVVDLKPSVIREILKFASQPGVISFAGGLPAPELFPLEDLKAVCSQVLDSYGAPALQYTLTRGITPLRELLAQRETSEGGHATADNIMITTGAQQGIEMLARTFLNPGDYILTENPTYVGALQVFGYYQARYCTVDMDEDGMIVDQVEDRLRQYRPKFIYVISDFQNPTGITMSLERRKALVAVAARYHVPIVDDNPYAYIRFAGTPLPSLKSLGGDGVIALRTFSKTVTPGLRVGWIVGPGKLMAILEKVKQFTDLHSSTFNQYMIFEYMKSGRFEPHVQRIRDDYLMKRNLMLKLLEDRFPKGITWTRPEGGLFLWLTLPEHCSAQALFQQAVDLKVAYVPGAPFFANGGGENTLRLNFSNALPAQIDEGVARLANLFAKYVK